MPDVFLQASKKDSRPIQKKATERKEKGEKLCLDKRVKNVPTKMKGCLKKPKY